MRDLFGARPGSEIDRIAREWVQRVALRQMTAAQADALRQWCQADPRHGAAFAEAHRLWQGMAPAAALSEARGRERRLSRPARRAFLGAGLACAATGRAWPWLRRHSACGRPGAIGRRLSHRQGRAAPRRIAGAAVLDLNTRTSIALRAAGVELISGEAAISLAGASSPFTVSAAGGRVVARDAVFELRHTDGSVCVTCLSGAVEVALASGGATWRRRSGWSMTRRACSPRARWMPTICRPGARVSCASGRRPGPGAGRDQPLSLRPRHPDGAIAGRQARQRAGGAGAAGHGHRADSRELPARRHRLARRRAAAGLIRPRRAAGESLPSARGASFSMWSDHKNRLLFPRRSV